MRTHLARMVDILDAIERIERYALRGRSAFDEAEMVQAWIVHHNMGRPRSPIVATSVKESRRGA